MNSTNTVLLGIALAAVFVLFGVNYFAKNDPSLSEAPPVGSLAIDSKEVKGMAIERDGKIFTLNQKQQIEALSYVNRLIPVDKKAYDQKKKTYNFSRIIIYRFNKPDVVLIPVAQEDSGIVFDIPILSSGSYMLDMSGGYFLSLIEKSTES